MAASQGASPPGLIFISYSHADKRWLDRITTHLRPLEREGVLDRWDDTRIGVGVQWRDELRLAVDSAKVAVLLISSDFLASDFIANEELPALLQAAQARGTVIMPIIVAPCRFLETPDLARYQAVNPPSKPLSAMSRNEREETFHRLAQAIDKAIKP